MGVLDFIFGVIVVVAVVFIMTGIIVMKYDTKKLKEENQKLFEDLAKERKRKMKNTNKKVGGEK